LVIGLVVVVAAGNENQHKDSIYCPGIAPDALTVGAITQAYQLAPFSSIGKPGDNKPNVVAPGWCVVEGILYNGTSFAAPIVTGVIGAILYSTGSTAKAVDHIYNTATDLGLPSHYQGKGCINIEKLVEVIKNEAANSKSAGQDTGLQA
jgi:subtilisin family serine protease